MFNNKFLATLIGLTIAVLAIWYSDFGNSGSILENFVNVPQTAVVMPLAGTSQGGVTALPQGATLNKQMGFPSPRGNLGSSPMFMIPGTYQNSLEPRMNANNNYGAYLRYNMPSEEHLAVPEHPLTFGNMVHENYSKENYCSSGGCGSVQSCSAGGVTSNVAPNAHQATPSPLQSGHSSNSYNAELDSLPIASHVTSDLPVPDMGTLNVDGTVDENPIVYNRMMFANQKSKLHGLGCGIRGDLAIAPCSGKWFNVSARPSIDLRSGAMAVLGGIGNETSQELYQLQYQSSGTSDSTLGGVDLTEALNVSAQKAGYQGMATNDVQFTAFP